jgi:hypothetical protein
MAITNFSSLRHTLNGYTHRIRAVGGLGFLLSSAFFGADNATKPAVAAIDATIQSLKEQPNQFTLSVTVTGVVANASAPGSTGLSVQVQGGGIGSQTTGLSVTTSSGQVQIAQAAADEAMRKQSEQAIKLLTEIKSLLEKPKAKVDKPTIMARLAEFGKTYVAPALKTVIETLVKAALGVK